MSLLQGHRGGPADLVVVVRTSGLAGAFLTCRVGGGRDSLERIFYKSGAGTVLGKDPLGFGIGPLGMGFLDEEDGGVLRCYDCMYET